MAGRIPDIIVDNYVPTYLSDFLSLIIVLLFIAV